MNILDRINGIIDKMNTAGVSEADILSVLKRLVNSSLVGILVKLSPNKSDDAVLAFLKELFPA